MNIWKMIRQINLVIIIQHNAKENLHKLASLLQGC
jgi:hypothetical protein